MRPKFLECILTTIMEERAVVNALQFKEMTGTSLSQLEMRALEHAEKYLSENRL
ncbi:MAG: hypothetical protein WA395_13385 [Nitrososphaeraceae archaeon]